MLLRSITKHVKDQNWFAVGVDFLIVVVGVFVGLQVQNWNADRQTLQQEQQVLEQLSEQFNVFISKTEAYIVLQNTIVDASTAFLNTIQRGEEPEDREQFKKTLALMNAYRAAGPQPTALVELVSSGRLSDLSSLELRTSLTSFYQAYADHEETNDITLVLITSPLNKFNNVIVTDPNVAGEIKNYDWEQLPNLRPEVQNLHTGKRILLSQMEELRDQAKSIQSEIEQAIK